MKKHILLSALLSCLFITPFAAQANDKVGTFYNPQLFQQVCKGKSEGTPVSFPSRGILWNGTCQVQFFPSAKTTTLKGDEKELSSICKTDPNSKVINIEGTEFKGKCAMGYAAPAPQ
ncbi:MULTISPECIES: hypothetical protein [unclassified Acinetobacter]|uniref:hypothetical protein n=1 Tax=unclassified Acinetobacter TaxID=196816 RepID=UPI002934F2E2|nr:MULTISPECIES: hypothetical protein [unclassified Acinetobacter]WOE31810.1 hypothetical protein QSG84_00890 [Acinetobacter sp. SAAs470]WOE37277.1 hypothetical protein QSG86_09935 [Acinetobacter sp. SAAs474]